MKLIIGGAHQGKTIYASETYQISEEDWTDGRTCEPDAVFTAVAVHHFHSYLKRRIDSGKETAGFAGELLEKNPDLLVVTDEVGYGVVPIDRSERIWREACGRVCTVLAAQADSVVRVCCGIGQKLK